MSVLDPRQFLLPSFYLDPATAALLGSPSTLLGSPSTLLGSPSNLLGSPQIAHGKMVNSSFRISDILHSPNDQNTSGDSDPRGSSEECRSSPLLGSPQPEDSLRGSPNEDGPSKKARKARTIFTDKQLQELETTFEKHKYLSVQDRMDLAHRMGLSDTQVKTWYQNRRTKWKRQASVGMDLLSDAGNMAAVQQLLRTNPYWASCLGSIGSLGSIPQNLPSFPPTSMGGPSPLQMQSSPFLMGIPPFHLMIPQNHEIAKVHSPRKEKQMSPPLDVSSTD